MTTWTRKRGLFCVGLLVAAATTGCGGGGGGSGRPATTASTLTSTSTSTVTTSTTLGTGDLYTIRFDLDDAITVGSLQLELDYSSANGEFAGSGPAVSCTSPLSAAGVLAVFHDVDASTQLNFAAVATTGFAGPTAMADCTFIASGAAPALGDFVITVLEANTSAGAAIAPLPTVTVSAVTPR